MISVSVFYPQGPGKHFDHAYYAQTHMPMVGKLLADHGLKRYEIERGLSGLTPGSEPAFVAIAMLYFDTLSDFQNSLAAHGAEILADIPNYTNIEAQFQINEIG